MMTSAASLLTTKQRDELDYSIYSYLNARGLSKAAAAFADDASLADPTLNATKHTGLLEKKWTSVIRLQKKVLDLESKVAQLQEEVSLGPARRSAGTGDWLPRAPEKHELQGHRSPVTKIAFHPVYTVLASASEDSTVKIWVSTEGREATWKSIGSDRISVRNASSFDEFGRQSTHAIWVTAVVSIWVSEPSRVSTLQFWTDFLLDQPHEPTLTT
jgi:hypothetical protein